ncbi:stress-related protein [Gossypium hirsutum]|uniref:Stress-related protein n=1 Tax=Gossypium hirsutum TaxID=3635 RepID=A0ABM3BA54_GOSHI|nr:stress-related protein-like [Gossypium hirsutum]
MLLLSFIIDANFKQSTEVESTAKLTAEIEANLENIQKKLKHLYFVQVASIYTVVCVSRMHEYTKENSSALKSRVQIVEEIVKTIIGLFNDKFRNVLFELFKIFYRKVDKLLSPFECHVPSVVKHASSQARTVASKVQQVRVVDAAKSITRNVYTRYGPTTKEMYDKYEVVAKQYAVFTWRTLNRLSLFPQMAHLVVPTNAYWLKKYNQVVQQFGEKWCVVAAYLPLGPNDIITKVFMDNRGAPIISSNGKSI